MKNKAAWNKRYRMYKNLSSRQTYCRLVNNISVCYWNIDGLFSRCASSRTCKLDLDCIRSNIAKHDIVFLVETHCGPDENVSFDGYKIFSNYRKKTKANNRYYGGIMTLVQNDLLRSVKIITPDCSEIQWISLSRSAFNIENDIYLGVAYIAPKTSNFTLKSNDDIFDILEANIAKYNLVTVYYMKILMLEQLANQTFV